MSQPRHKRGAAVLAFSVLVLAGPGAGVSHAVPRHVAFRSDEASLLGVVDSVHASIVTVVGYPPPDPSGHAGKRRRLIGSAVAMAPDRIIASASVAIPGGSVRVLLGNGVERPAILRGVDRQSNIALFQVEGAQLEPLHAAPPQSPAVGSWVAVVSNVGITRPQAAIGQIVGRGERVDEHTGGDIFEIDAPTYPGSTGAAILNEDGEWIAMVVGRAAPSTSDGSPVGLDSGESMPGPSSVLIALPVDQVMYITKELDTYGSVRRGFLGVQLKRGPASPSDSLGILVANVVPGSPADSSGLRVGDRILAVDGQEAHTADDLTAIVRAMRPGDDVELTVLRKDDIFPIRVVLGAAFTNPPVGPRPSREEEIRRAKTDLNRLEMEKRQLEQRLRTLEGSSSR
ncbi:MAG TPA: trypsin-like peptidase domain-containing protein [Candidatus Eisenbacteria bacterium]|nr:trypsin-like peptidase domain-containing protein [Candidatus Eisenbacteria bacterium]